MPSAAPKRKVKAKSQCWTRKKKTGQSAAKAGMGVLGRPYRNTAEDDCMLMLMCSMGGLPPKKARAVIRQGGGGSGGWLRGTEEWGDDA
jgi:hypothetical protein